MYWWLQGSSILSLYRPGPGGPPAALAGIPVLGMSAHFYRPPATSSDGFGSGASVPLIIREDSLSISLRGHLTGSSAAMMRLHLLTLAATGGPEELILNLSDVHAIDPDGAEPLLEAQELQHRRGGILRIESPSSVVLQFLCTQRRFARLLIPPGQGMSALTPRSHDRAHLQAVQTYADTSHGHCARTEPEEEVSGLRSLHATPADSFGL